MTRHPMGPPPTPRGRPLYRALLALFTASFLLVACQTSSPPPGGGDGGPPLGDDGVFITYELKDHARIADAATLAALTDFELDSSELRFRQATDLVADLEPGMVLLAGESEAAPFGFIREVVAVRQEGGSTIVETEIAALEEAFSDLDMVFQRELEFDDVVQADLADGVALQAFDDPGPGELAPAATIGKSFRMSLDKELYRSGTGTVRSVGDIDLGIAAFADLKIKTKFKVPTGIERFEVGLDIEEELDLRILADFDGQRVDARVSLGSLAFGAICAGPVCFAPVVEFFIGVDGTVSASMEFAANQQLSVRIGTRYSGGDWSNLSSFDHSYESGFPVRELRSLDARGYARVEGKLCPYGLCEAAAGGYAEAYLRYQYDQNANPLWQLHAGVDAGVFIEIKIKVVVTLVDERWDKRWRIFETLLDRANFVPELYPVRPSDGFLLDASEGADDYLAVSIVDWDGPPAANPIAVRWHSSIDGVLQEAPATVFPLPPARQYSQFPSVETLSPGIHRITVTATDGEGESDERGFTLRVIPIEVQIRPRADNIGANQERRFRATVSGTDDERVQWSSSCGTVIGTGPEITYRAPSTADVTCTLTATSVADSTESFSLPLDVLPANAPTATITSPSNEATFRHPPEVELQDGVDVDLKGVGLDAQDLPLPSDDLRWFYRPYDPLDAAPWTFVGTGTDQTVFLPFGDTWYTEYELRLEARDTDLSLTNSDRVTIAVIAPSTLIDDSWFGLTREREPVR